MPRAVIRLASSPRRPSADWYLELFIAQNVSKKDRAWGTLSWFKTHPAAIRIRDGRSPFA